jgi:hypothetical protein
VKNVCANFRDVRLKSASCDAFTVIDETYLYLRSKARTISERWSRPQCRFSLRAGRSLLHFENNAAFVERMGAERRFWAELPRSNPFRYALYRQEASRDHRTVRTESIYISRRAADRLKVELTEVCDVDELCARILECGFARVDRDEDFAFTAFVSDSSRDVVLVARR